MARRARGRGSSRGGRNRYAWHGFYQPVLIVPPDVNNDLFILYDPIDDDHQEEAVLKRIRGEFYVQNTNASGAIIGFGIFLCERDSVGSILNAPSPRSPNKFDIEAN